jgi:hypothetical protein
MTLKACTECAHYIPACDAWPGVHIEAKCKATDFVGNGEGMAKCIDARSREDRCAIAARW